MHLCLFPSTWTHLHGNISPFHTPHLSNWGFFSSSSGQKWKFPWKGRKTGNFGAGFCGRGWAISWHCRLWVQNLSGSQHINNQLYSSFPLLVLSAIRHFVADEMVVGGVFICFLGLFGVFFFCNIYIFILHVLLFFPQRFWRFFFSRAWH